MIDFVLDYLCSPTGKGFDAGLEFSSLPLNFDSLVTFARAGASEQRKATFFGIIRS